MEIKSNNFGRNIGSVPWLGASDSMASVKGNVQIFPLEGSKTFRAK